MLGRLGVRELDHTALAVRDLAIALRLYRDLLGGVPHQYEEQPRRGFRWLTLRYPSGSQLELIAPLGEHGFLQSFLEKHGEGIHHLTFMVDDLQQAVAEARAAGLRVVDEDYSNPEWQEAFISPTSAHGTIVQLAQSSLSPAERDHAWHVPEKLE